MKTLILEKIHLKFKDPRCSHPSNFIQIYWKKILKSFFLKTYLSLFYAYEYFASLNICAPCVCLVPLEVRRKHQIPRK